MEDTHQTDGILVCARKGNGLAIVTPALRDGLEIVVDVGFEGGEAEVARGGGERCTCRSVHNGQLNVLGARWAGSLHRHASVDCSIIIVQVECSGPFNNTGAKARRRQRSGGWSRRSRRGGFGRSCQ